MLLLAQITEVEFASAESPAIEFPGIDGFLGTRASLMLDVVVLAMLAVVPILIWSILQVRRGRYLVHKRTQITLAILLLVAVTLFEIDMRIYGWESRAAGQLGGSASRQVWILLYLHLSFAISTALLWPVVLVRAWRQFPVMPAPSQHSPSHRLWGKLAAGGMIMTAITGWLFYIVAFVF